jgi:spermidine synthase
MGAAFPLAARVLVADGRPGAAMGRAYAVNIVGGIAGAFSAGFVLIAFLGLENAFLVASAFAFGAALLVHAADAAPRRSVIVGGAALAAFALFALFGPRRRAVVDEHDRHVVFYKEGKAAIVIVRDLVDGSRSIQIDDFSAAGTSYYHLRNQRMMGYLPLLVAPRPPTKALVICFGTGTTVGSLAQMDGLEVTSVEIDADVYEAAPFFAEANHDAVRHPRVHRKVDDGRHFVAVTAERYDIITSEPLHPKRAGTVNLYSEDYYRSAAKKLAPGGLLAQWLPLHGFERPEFRSVVRAFAAVFPYTYLWLGEQMILLGKNEPLRIDWTALADRMALPAIATDLRAIAFDDPHAVVASFLAVEKDIARYVEGAPTITDDLPTIEYSKTDTSYDVFSDLSPYRSDIRGFIDNRDARFSEERFATRMRVADLVLEAMSRFKTGDREGALRCVDRGLSEEPDEAHLLRLRRDFGGGLVVQ